MELIAQQEFARRKGVSKSTISRWKAAGLLVLRDGKVDGAESERLLEAHRTALDKAKTAEMVYRAKLRALDFAKRREQLVEADLVKARWAAIGDAVRLELEAWPEAVVPSVAPLTDERQVRDPLKRAVHDLIRRLRTAVIEAR